MYVFAIQKTISLQIIPISAVVPLLYPRNSHNNTCANSNTCDNLIHVTVALDKRKIKIVLCELCRFQSNIECKFTLLSDKATV